MIRLILSCVMFLPCVVFAQYFPLKVSANGLYFEDQNSTPIFLNGDGGWDLSTAVTYAAADTYLTDCQQKGINYIHTRMITTAFIDNAPNNVYNVSPFTGRVFTSPRELYFAHLDSIVWLAHTKRIVLQLYPCYLGYGCAASEGWCPSVDTTAADSMKWWGQYVGNRYKNFPNILWGIGGDADPTARKTKLDSLVAGSGVPAGTCRGCGHPPDGCPVAP